jgi:glyoxylate reductase
MAKSILISNVLPAEARRVIPQEIAVDYNDSGQPMPRVEFIRRLQGKDGLICHIISAIDDELLAACPGLKVVANVAVGYNNIDVAAATARGIVVTNTPEVLTDATADLAWALIMDITRRVSEGDRLIRRGG